MSSSLSIFLLVAVVLLGVVRANPILDHYTELLRLEKAFMDAGNETAAEDFRDLARAALDEYSDEKEEELGYHAMFFPPNLLRIESKKTEAALERLRVAEEKERKTLHEITEELDKIDKDTKEIAEWFDKEMELANKMFKMADRVINGALNPTQQAEIDKRIKEAIEEKEDAEEDRRRDRYYDCLIEISNGVRLNSPDACPFNFKLKHSEEALRKQFEKEIQQRGEMFKVADEDLYPSLSDFIIQARKEEQERYNEFLLEMTPKD